MNTIYIRELEKYSFNNILNKFKIKDEKKGTFLLDKLKKYGVIKILKNKAEDIDLSDLSNESIESLYEDSNSHDKKYVFKYVGIITVMDYVIICYPKYIKKTKEPELEMKQILKVIKKYNSEEQMIKLYSERIYTKTYNYLGIIISLINEYYENGLYSKSEQSIELNGEGEIFWDKTINETYAYIFNNRPCYLELYTINTVNDEQDYFTKLHQVILTECSRKLGDLKLRNLLEIEEIELSEHYIDEFGEKEYILYRLERELNQQYVTKKQNILKVMYAYIASSKNEFDGIGTCFYGTNNFNLVWESVCSKVLKNKINIKLKNLPLNGFTKYGDNTLKEIIEKPVWKIYSDGRDRVGKKTFIPDLISIFKLNNEYMFAIFDAKYYDIKYNEVKIWNQPGVDDVAKQYLYQLAYEEFINKSGYKFITNSFLIPTEGKMACIGQAKMNILGEIKSKKLKDIDVLELNAISMYDAYINSENIEVQEIVKLINGKEWNDKTEYSIGVKIIVNIIKKMQENNKSYNSNISYYNYVNEDKETYLKENLVEKLAIELDNYFKRKKDIEVSDIKKEIEEKIFSEENLNIDNNILEKLKSVHDDFYLIMYWNK